MEGICSDCGRLCATVGGLASHQWFAHRMPPEAKAEHYRSVGKKISSAKMGHVVSTEARKKISEKLKEHYKAHPQVISPEQREKIRKSLMGHGISSETREKISKSVKHYQEKHGHYVYTVEDREKISAAQRGKILSEEHRKKIATGLHQFFCSPEGKSMKSHLSQKLSGENHPCWTGGTSLFPYPNVFTWSLKKRILERDGKTCQLCYRKTRLAVHHINYDKNECQESNLITLCRSCNSRVNFGRDKWQALFSEMVRDKGCHTNKGECGISSASP